MEEPLFLYRSVISEQDPGLDPEFPRALVHEKRPAAISWDIIMIILTQYYLPTTFSTKHGRAPRIFLSWVPFRDP